MACCMFAAFIVGNIALMWRRVVAWWSPARAAAEDARLTASAWRPGMLMTEPACIQRNSRWTMAAIGRPVGALLIVMSMSYFAVQAKDALEQASDARSFAVLLAQNICRANLDTAPDSASNVAPASPVQIAFTQPNPLK